MLKEVYESVISKNLTPTISTFNNLVVSCADVKDKEFFMFLTNEMKRFNIEKDKTFFNAKIECFCDDLSVSIPTFDQMKDEKIQPNTNTYKIMIGKKKI